MSGSGPVEFFVDSGELDRLRGELEALRDELVGLSGVMAVDHDEQRFGGWDIASTVGDFSGGWQAGRDRLAEQLGAAAGFVRLAVVQYEGVEGVVHAAAGRSDGR